MLLKWVVLWDAVADTVSIVRRIQGVLRTADHSKITYNGVYTENGGNGATFLV